MTLARPAAFLLAAATANLSRRMLLPALFGRNEDGELNRRRQIGGTARSDLDDAGFRGLARAAKDSDESSS